MIEKTNVKANGEELSNIVKYLYELGKEENVHYILFFPVLTFSTASS